MPILKCVLVQLRDTLKMGINLDYSVWGSSLKREHTEETVHSPAHPPAKTEGKKEFRDARDRMFAFPPSPDSQAGALAPTGWYLEVGVLGK